MKRASLPKVIYIMQYQSYPNDIFIELKREVLKFIRKHKRPWVSKAIQSKKNIARNTALSDLILYYRFTITKHNTGTKIDM